MIHADEGGKVDMMYNVEELFIVGLICVIIDIVAIVLYIKRKYMGASSVILRIISSVSFICAMLIIIKVSIFHFKCQESGRESYDVFSARDTFFHPDEVSFVNEDNQIETVTYSTVYADDHTHLDKIVYTYKNLYSYDYIYYKKLKKGTDE